MQTLSLGESGPKTKMAADCAKLRPMQVHPLTRPRRAIYGVIAAASLTGLVEIGMRLGGVSPAYRPELMGQWQTHPNLKDHTMVGSREPHNFSMSTNSDGLRTEVRPARTSGIFRVVLMGDSNVFGWGLNDDETLVAQTQRLLGAEESPIEIINAGQPGYSTAQSAWLFSETIQSYTPDLTIVFLSMHDHNRVLVSDTEVWRGPKGPMAWLRVTLARHSRIYESLRRVRHTRSAEPQLMPQDTEEAARVPRVSDEDRGLVLAEMRELAHTWGGSVGLGLMPDVSDLRQGATGGSFKRIGQQWGEDWTAEAQSPMVNLRTCCPEGGEALVFPFDNGHMNSKGNAAAAKALAVILRAER